MARIREIDEISQAAPRPRRLAAQDREIADCLDRLDRQADIIFDNFEVIDREVGRREDSRRDDDKRALARIILEGQRVERELGQVSSQSEARLGPQAFEGDLATRRYHTGAANDPIPIVWYKNPTAYRPIVIPANPIGVTPGNYDYPNGPTTAHGFPVDLTVAAANQPDLNNFNAFQLIKQPLGSRPARTPNKDAANTALRDAGFNLRTQAPQLDGDHVRDLGFGGDDAVDNYWPLDERINRRAFHGYNGSYMVNFIDHTKDAGQVNPNGNPRGRPVTQAIGGMAGRHFEIKSYMANNDAANVPVEGKSDDVKAWSGTDRFA